MRSGAALLGALLTAAPAWADCPSDLAGVRAELDVAEAAYGEFDFETYSLQVVSLIEDAGCLEELLTPEDAARLHLARALDGWVRRAEVGDQAFTRIELALRGLMAADPDYAPPDDLMPEGSQLRAIYDAAKSVGIGDADPLTGEGWLVDGGAAEGLPMERLALIQFSGAEGVETWYVEGASIPGELRELMRITARATRSDDSELPSEDHLSEGPRTSRALLISGLAAGVVAGAGVGLAAWSQGEYLEESDPDEAEGLYALNRVSGVGGYAAAGVAGGLVVSAVLVGRW